MKNRLALLKFPSSLFGKKITILLGLIFLLLPFQTPLFHKAFKTLSLSIIPSSLSLPDYFPHKIAFFPTEFFLIVLLFLFRKQAAAFFWSGPSKYLTLLFSIALLSLALSPSATYLLMYTRFLEIALIIVLFNAIRTAFDAETALPFIRLLAWLLFYLSLFECSIALFQFVTQSSLGLKCIGECDIQSYAYPMANAHRFLFDNQTSRHFLIRASGTFPHPNIFGGFLFCALLNTFYLYFTQHKKKLLLLSGILIQVPTLILTFSRAALIAFALTTAIWFILQVKRRKEVIQLTLTLISLAALCLCLFYHQLSARGGILNYNKLVQGADSERLIYQKIAWEMVKERPLLGVGLNNFQMESHRYFPEGSTFPSRVHNIYLLLAAETGLIGASCFFLFLLSLLRHAKRALRSQEGLFLLMLFSGFLFIGACDFYLLCTPHGQILFFSAAALLHVISRVNQSDLTIPK